MPSAKILAPILSFRKDVPRANGAAVDGACQMADQAARDAAVRKTTGTRALCALRGLRRRTTNLPALRRPGPAPSGPRGGRRSTIIVALHAGAFAAQHGAGQRIAAAAIAAGEAVAGASATEKRLQLASAPSELVTPLMARAASSASAPAPAATWPTPPLCRRGRGRASYGSAIPPGDAADRILRHRTRHIDGALRKRAQRRGAKSVEETKAWRWPTNTRRPRSRPSLLSSFSRSGPCGWATEIDSPLT